MSDQPALVWHHTAPAALNALAAEGLTQDHVRELLQVVSPLRLPPLLPKEKRFIYAAVADRFVPAAQVRALEAHWEHPATCWYPATAPSTSTRCSRRSTPASSVGWAGADGSELDAATMANTVIVDSREGALLESGNVRRWGADIHAELGDILGGSALIDPAQTIVFESIGMACQDLAAAALVMDKLELREPSR